MNGEKTSKDSIPEEGRIKIDEKTRKLFKDHDNSLKVSVEDKSCIDFIEDLKTHCADEIQGSKSLIKEGVNSRYYEGMKDAYEIVLEKIKTFEGEDDA